MRRPLPQLLLFAGLAACGATSRPVPTPVRITEPYTLQRDLPYVEPVVDREHQSLDLYLPRGAPPAAGFPLVVWVHGGGWCKGDKARGMPDRADHLVRLGYAVASVGYRLSPNPPDPDAVGAVRHPDHVQDVAAATAWLIAHAADQHLDATRVALVGFSAGGHLAALTAVDPRWLAADGASSASVRCLVTLDSAAFDIPTATSRGGDLDLYLSAFGADPEVWADASPLRHVAADHPLPDALLLTRGSDPRREDVDAFAQALRGAGRTVYVADVEPLGHAEVEKAYGSADDGVVTPVVDDFLGACLPPR
ncbi:MAG: alpha/beta hydrolase [Alphaproteobacteria bacterium]|nr:alpha/beta hydrolase [Alphaproteobacteria bacterium]